MMPVSYGTKEAVYLSNFLGELGFRSYKTVPVNCDSTGAISVIANRPYSSRAKHVALRFFFRELVKMARSPFITYRPELCARRCRNDAPLQELIPVDYPANQRFFLLNGYILEGFPIV